MATARTLMHRIGALEQSVEDDELARAVRRLLDEASLPELFDEAMAEAVAVRAEYRRLVAAGVTHREIVEHFAAGVGLTVEEYEREMAAEMEHFG